MTTSPPPHVVVVGGGGAGAGAATRLRRLNNQVQISILEQGEHVSFANCGLPYYVGNMMEEERLTVVKAATFKERFNIAVRTRTAVVAIDRAARQVRVRRVDDQKKMNEENEEEVIAYDALLLAVGAQPLRPIRFVTGLDRPEVLTLRTIPDANAVKALVPDARHAVIMGAGFIGIEMAEQLRERSLDLNVRVLEMAPHILPVVDYEMVSRLTEALRDAGIGIHCGDAIAGVEDATADDRAAHGACKLVVTTKSGARHPADLVICSLGVRPETALAQAAGVEVDQRTAAIKVDNAQRVLCDDRVFAAGDCCEIDDYVTGRKTMVPLAGPANRQGRTAAESIAKLFGSAIVPHPFRGAQATAVVGAYGVSVATTGVTSSSLKHHGVAADSYYCIHVHGDSHVTYYPGATTIHLKVFVDKESKKIWGAQATGLGETVVRRIDVLATFIQLGATVCDLLEAELCYSPQYGAPKDEQNMVGMIGENIFNGILTLASWDEWTACFSGDGVVEKTTTEKTTQATETSKHPSGNILLDVRCPNELQIVRVNGAIEIPLPQLRSRCVAELPKDKVIDVTCRSGQRAWFAASLLRNLGYNVRVLSGGVMTGMMKQHVRLPAAILT